MKLNSEVVHSFELVFSDFSINLISSVYFINMTVEDLVPYKAVAISTGDSARSIASPTPVSGSNSSGGIEVSESISNISVAEIFSSFNE